MWIRVLTPPSRVICKDFFKVHLLNSFNIQSFNNSLSVEGITSFLFKQEIKVRSLNEPIGCCPKMFVIFDWLELLAPPTCAASHQYTVLPGSRIPHAKQFNFKMESTVYRLILIQPMLMLANASHPPKEKKCFFTEHHREWESFTKVEIRWSVTEFAATKKKRKAAFPCFPPANVWGWMRTLKLRIHSWNGTSCVWRSRRPRKRTSTKANIFTATGIQTTKSKCKSLLFAVCLWWFAWYVVLAACGLLWCCNLLTHRLGLGSCA